MYGLAYAFLRRGFVNLQNELNVALAPFKRGCEKDFTLSALAFDDATGDLRILHQAEFEYKGHGTIALGASAAGQSWFLGPIRLSSHLDALGFEGFRGTFAEIEPDFNRFVRGYSTFRKRDAKTARCGSWLNQLGRWDWWELGGRFNGVISGERLAASDASGISSGANTGRDTIASTVEGFGGKPPNPRPRSKSMSSWRLRFCSAWKTAKRASSRERLCCLTVPPPIPPVGSIASVGEKYRLRPMKRSRCL